MPGLAERFYNLKKSIPGNRELRGYEETFGQPMEEQNLITMQGEFVTRIISELCFALRLSKKYNGEFDSVIDEALTFLEEKMKKQSILIDDDCLKAEKILMPLSAKAKEYKLIMVGHAHIDMNWMWGYNETVSITLSTVRTVLNLMREYPDFCFSQSQASVYEIIEKFAPEMMPEVKERINEGRWEVTASAWVETDKNMPNTESLLRHIKYTKNYLKKVWGLDPDKLNIDFSPDTFGHSANLPEIDHHGNVKYYYHCRGLDIPLALYRWKTKSGKETLNYCEQRWYNAAVTPAPGIGIVDIEEKCGGLKTGLAIFGVGDHGGGPTRRDIERVYKIQKWPVFPEYRFGTLGEFFRTAETVRDKLPVFDEEINCIFPGCYTTQSRIKMGNRQCEAALSCAENAGALSKYLLNNDYDLSGQEKAWRNVLFTHFHDIITGSCVQDSREYAMGILQTSHAFAQSALAKAMREISESTDTSGIYAPTDSRSQSEGGGAGYNGGFGYLTPVEETGSGYTRIFTVFNPTAVTKKEPVEITAWDWTGNASLATVEDAEGNPLDFQILTNTPGHFWDHKFTKFLVEVSLPPLSYTTVVLKQKELEEYPCYANDVDRRHHPTDNFVLENDYVRAEFDFSTGEMLSFVSKEDGKEYIKPGEKAGFVLIDTESATSSAWCIGRYLKTHPVDDVIRIHTEVTGKIRNGFFVKMNVMNSNIEAHVSLDKNSRFIAIKTRIDWNESGKETIPVLAYRFPAAYEAEKYLFDIPGGTICRKGEELDKPALNFISAKSGEKYNASLVCDCKYGYRGRKNGEMIVTLLNTSTSPDPYPERAIHELTIYAGISESSPDKAEKTALSLIRPLSYQPTLSHKGILPCSGKLFDVSDDGAVISAVSQADDGDGLIIRMYNAVEREVKPVFTFDRPVKEAYTVDLFENKVSGEVTVSGPQIRARIPAGEIMTVKIVF